MSKASRKIERYNERVQEKENEKLTEEEIQAQYGNLSFIQKVSKEVSVFTWIDIKNWVNILLMLAIWVFVSVTVEAYLNTITTVVSAAMIAHGICTSLLMSVVFTFLRKKEDADPITTETFLIRFISLGVVFALISAFTSVYF